MDDLEALQADYEKCYESYKTAVRKRVDDSAARYRSYDAALTASKEMSITARKEEADRTVRELTISADHSQAVERILLHGLEVKKTAVVVKMAARRHERELDGGPS